MIIDDGRNDVPAFEQSCKVGMFTTKLVPSKSFIIANVILSEILKLIRCKNNCERCKERPILYRGWRYFGSNLNYVLHHIVTLSQHRQLQKQTSDIIDQCLIITRTHYFKGTT